VKLAGLVVLAAGLVVVGGTAPARALTMNENWVDLLYEDTLGRDPSSGELSTLAGLVDQGTSRVNVALGVVLSAEFDTLTVQGFFQDFLGRPADSTSLQTFVPMLQGGVRDETVLGAVLGSAEYFATQAMSDNATFINELFMDVLGRPAGAGEVAALLPVIQASSRQAVADVVLNSIEFRERFVTGLFIDYLDRRSPPAQAEVTPFVTLIAMGATLDQTRALILGSQEHFDIAQVVAPPGGGGGAAVPEPGTMLLALATGVTAATRAGLRRRQARTPG
jgi:hypothetical protein